MNIHGIAAVILAAGESRRMGSLKPLLIWKEENFLNTLIETCDNSSLNPIVIVTGFKADEVEKQIKKRKNIIIARNENWASGQGGSIAAGVSIIKEYAKAVVILLVDQPQVSKKTITSLVSIYQENEKPIVITSVGDVLTPPVLMASICFDKLVELKGDEGAKKLLNEFEFIKNESDDANILIDIDTEGIYKSILKKY